MPTTMELKDGKLETLFSDRDFAYLVEKYMGYEAADYFRRILEENASLNEELQICRGGV